MQEHRSGSLDGLFKPEDICLLGTTHHYDLQALIISFGLFQVVAVLGRNRKEP